MENGDYYHEVGAGYEFCDIFKDPEGNIVSADVIVGALNLVPRLRSQVEKVNVEMGELMQNICKLLVEHGGWDQKRASEELRRAMLSAEEKAAGK